MFGFTRIQRALLFPRHWVVPPARGAEVPGLERWWHATDEGDVETWFLPGRGVSRERSGPVVVFLHGNGELIDHWPWFLEPYRQRGVSVLLPEYRGYGRSAGKPSERALVADLCLLQQRMRSEPRIDMAQVAYHGRSLGGGLACALARLHAPKLLILQSTFTSVVDVARGMGIPGWCVRDRFESLPVVQRFDGPILVLHGSEDRLIPKLHAERLAASNPRARLVLYRAGHNDLPPAGSNYWQEIEATLQQGWGVRSELT